VAKVSGQFKEVTNLAFSSFKKQKFESVSFGLFCVSLFVVVFVANVCCNSFELFFVLCCISFRLFFVSCCIGFGLSMCYVGLNFELSTCYVVITLDFLYVICVI